MNYDMIIQNCKVYNSFTKSFEYTDVAVKNGIFTHIEKNIMLDNTYVVDGKRKVYDTWFSGYSYAYRKFNEYSFSFF